MDPGTIAILVGSAISAMGALQAGANAQETGRANARSMFEVAHAERVAGEENSKRQDRLNRKRTGAGRALDLSDDVMNDAELEMALMEADITHGAEIKAVSLENRGRFSIWQGDEARKRSYTQAAATIAMGVGTAGMGGGFSNPFASTTSNLGLPLPLNTPGVTVLA